MYIRTADIHNYTLYVLYIYIYTSIYMYVVSLATDEGEFIILNYCFIFCFESGYTCIESAYII